MSNSNFYILGFCAVGMGRVETIISITVVAGRWGTFTLYSLLKTLKPSVILLISYSNLEFF